MKSATKPFAICIDDTDYKASPIRGKAYQILPDPKAARDDLVRIVDESGEDYLYHRSHFVGLYVGGTVELAVAACRSRRRAGVPRRAFMSLTLQIS